jgi:hypothetical protein
MLLDRLGNPADIALEANERFDAQDTRGLDGYGFRRRIAYFFVAVPVVFVVLWLILTVARAIAG